MKIHAPTCLASLLIALPISASTFTAGDTDWPQWRGPRGDGVSDASGLPATWGPETNVIWKTPMPYWCGSTPVIAGERIWLTSPSEATPEELAAHAEEVEKLRAGGDERDLFMRGKHPGGNELLLLCFSRASGEQLWRKVLATGNELHAKGNDASPSPVTDGERVWVVTGTGHVVAFDLEGAELWRRDLQADYGRFGLNWGYGSSPLLHEGRLIVPVLHGMHTDEPSYLLALDATSGKTLWKVERATKAPAESPDAYTTPLLLEHPDGAQVVISGADCVTGHDPASGSELWRVGGLNPHKQGFYRIVASPIAAGGMLYAPTRVRPLLAIEIGSDGRPGDDSVVWRWDKAGAPDVPSPVSDGRYFYMVNDAGLVTCLDAKTGKPLWGPERTVQGSVSSSLLLADGKLFFTNEEAVTVVLAAGAEFEQLAANELDGSYTLSSPVAAGNRLYLRTGAFLYCIGKP